VGFGPLVILFPETKSGSFGDKESARHRGQKTREQIVMTAMTRISALSTVLALGLWVGPAAAGDADTTSPAADDIVEAEGSQLEPSELSAASGGHAVDQDNVNIQEGVNHNTFTVTDGGRLNTGSINSSNSNSGGITVTMMNTGAGAVMQNATNINIYLSQQAPQ
jgi:hypothetical protein